jgi:lipoprotein-releasing system ATP-binding protein
MENKIALEANSIFKSFYDPAKIDVLKDLSFTIDRGDFVSITGKSGCGKSTLLYILSTMDSDYTGDVWLGSQLFSRLTPDELAVLRNEHIGFVFQFHYLLPEFTVLQNVMMPALKLGKKSKEQIEHDAMEQLRILDIEDQALKMATRISGGQKQRVAIARALINSPSIIMGDEPTGNLDSKNADMVFDLFKQLSIETGTSLLIVTHDDDFAKKTDRVITMADGEIISQ